MNKFVKLAGGILGSIALIGGLYINSQRETFINDAVTKIEEKASQAVGTPIKIGSVDVDDINFSEFAGSSITVRDIEILDKNSERIATADTAKINFKLLSLYDDGAGAIDEINISGVKLDLKKRADNSWNAEDITIKSEGESNFGAKVTVADSLINAEFDGKKISVTDINATADCSDLNAIGLNVDAKVFNSHVNASGVVGMESQVVNARVDTVDVTKFLPYLPENILPEALTINRGTLNQPQITVNRRGEILKYFVSSEVRGGAVKLEDTNIENINGNVRLNEDKVWFQASAIANGQSARAKGNVYIKTDEPVFDIYAESENFSPSAIINNIGVEGAANFTAHLTGTTKRPQVEADIFSPFASYDNLSVGNLNAHLNYFDDKIYLTDVSGETFGGEVSGEVEIITSNLAYNAHVKANGIDAAQVLSFADSGIDLSGIISADVAFNGVGTDMSKLKIYGSAKTARAGYQDFTIDDAKASFYYDQNVLKIDNLNAVLPNRGAIGVEGTISKDNNLDLEFFASHVDLASAKKISEQIDVSGLADIFGEVHGKLDNPQIKMKLSAVDSSSNGGEHLKGILFKQPYDAIKIDAAGSLDDMNINDFTLERGGKIIWKINNGTVALTGDKKINLEIDTVGARLEDIVALVAPEQEAAGNIDNKIKITGTIDNPNVTGKVHLHYGIYRGILITGMKGEYFYEGDKLKLQNFSVTSPMADVILNGTFDKTTGALNFNVIGEDISLKRFAAYFPENYYAEGHGTFEGELKGTVDNPDFIGQFVAPSLNLNGVELTDVHGKINYTPTNIFLDDVRFNQGDGNFKMDVDINTLAKRTNGKAELKNVDISSLLKVADMTDIPISGKLDSTLTISGDKNSPHHFTQLTGKISKGELGGRDIHDVELEITIAERIVNFNKLKGKQGDKGNFDLFGKIDRGGVLDLNFVANDIELALFSGAAKLDLDVKGTANIKAKVGGTVNDPTGEGTLTAVGSINGADFDLMKAEVLFKEWTFDVKDFSVQKTVANNVYKASASGTIPVQALYIDPGENLSPHEQLNLRIGLDDADLTLLPVFDKYVDWATGGLDGNITVKGTLAELDIDGIFAVDDGTIKLKFMESPIEHLNISTKFDGNRFDIKNFVGNIGKGNFNLSGGFNFANFTLKGYNFNLKMDALDIISEFFTGPLNAEFTVSEEQTFSGDTIPKLAGHIDLDKCTVGIPTIPESDDPLPNIILDITLNLGEKFRFYRSHLYDMYLIGSAHFEGTTLHPKSSGSINVKRGGTLTYANSVFDIREGEAYFNQLDSFFPTIHFAADTNLSRTQIFLSINGSLNDMKLKLTSSPEMTQTEILQALTLRENYEQGKQNIGASDIIALGLQMSLLADIEDAVRKTLGFDQLRLTRGTGSAFDYYTEEENKRENEFNVFIGKYISDKIMLRYTQGITGDKITRFGFQYDINDKIGITVEREGSRYILGLQARFNF